MGREVCFLNGRFVAVGKAALPVTDRGLLFGDALFETWRTYNGEPFALDDHLRRLDRAARAIGLPFDRSESWHARTRSLLAKNGLTGRSTAIRLTITRGSGPLRLQMPERTTATRLMLLRPIEAGVADARRTGVSVRLHPVGGGAGHRDMRRLKSTNYLGAVLARTEAAKHGCFEALYWLDDSTLLEGTTTNLFLVRRGRLLTPPVAAGLLPGVTRAIVLKLGARLGEVKEKRVTSRDLFAADEAFLTSTTIEIVPIVRVGRRPVGGGRVGPITRELQGRYRRLVARRLGLAVGELDD